MADQLNMGGLSLGDSQHAAGGPGSGGGRSAYIPPHLRGRMDGPSPASPGMSSSSWAAPP
jgi:ATP-dependent RNA helicase DDX3X